MLKEQLSNLFSKNNLNTSENQINQLERFFDFFVEQAKIINLTSIYEKNDILVKHFLDSAILLSFYEKDIFKGKTIVDIGSGGGFPGIILAILLPDSKFVFIDSTAKKINFLNKAIELLELNNSQAICIRAEEYQGDKFDYVISRGFAPIGINLEISNSLLKQNGKIILYKTSNDLLIIKQNIKLLNNILNLNLINSFVFLLENEYDRAFLEFSKLDSNKQIKVRSFDKIKKHPIF